jgi:hypothetical protein
MRTAAVADSVASVRKSQSRRAFKEIKRQLPCFNIEDSATNPAILKLKLLGICFLALRCSILT